MAAGDRGGKKTEMTGQYVGDQNRKIIWNVRWKDLQRFYGVGDYEGKGEPGDVIRQTIAAFHMACEKSLNTF